MNRKKLIFAALPSMLMLGACSRSAVVPEQEIPEYITVSTHIGALTKIATSDDGSQTFSEGDKISVYAWTGSADSAPSESALVVNNAVNTLSGGKWTAEPQMLWKNLRDKHYFVGIYPSRVQAEADLSKVAYKMDVADQEKSDLLVAAELSGRLAETNPVPLTFNHMMAKVVVELSFRNQWGGGAPEVEAVKLAGVASDAVIDCLTGVVTAGTDKVEMTVPETVKNTGYASVIVPQNGVNTISVVIDGKSYSYQHPAGFTFASGKITKIILVVGRNQLDLGDVKINDWETGEIIEDGEALD